MIETNSYLNRPSLLIDRGTKYATSQNIDVNECRHRSVWQPICHCKGTLASSWQTPAPYSLVPHQINIDAKNGVKAYGVRLSAKMDFKHGYDNVDEDTLNRVLWHCVNGANAHYPSPIRRAVLGANGKASAVSRDGDD